VKAGTLSRRYVLPVLLAGVEGALTSRVKGQYSFALAFGRLRLPPRGLSVDGVAYPQALDLSAGEAVAWSSERP